MGTEDELQPGVGCPDPDLGDDDMSNEVRAILAEHDEDGNYIGPEIDLADPEEAGVRPGRVAFDAAAAMASDASGNASPLACFRDDASTPSTPSNASPETPSNASPETPSWTPIAKAAKTLGINRSTIKRWHLAGRLPAGAVKITPTGYWLVRMDLLTKDV